MQLHISRRILQLSGFRPHSKVFLQVEYPESSDNINFQVSFLILFR